MKPENGHGSIENTAAAGSESGRLALCSRLTAQMGAGFSSLLGIDLASAKSDEAFKWLLACTVLGSCHQEKATCAVYQDLETANLVSTYRLLTTSWQSLMDILDRSGRIKHSFSLAIGLPQTAAALNAEYAGDLNRLHFFARDERDLEKRLGKLSKAVTPATVAPFLRGLRDLWEKANPPLAGDTLTASGRLGLTSSPNATVALEELRMLWEDMAEDQLRFSDLEAALTRLGRDYCRKRRCHVCPVREECPNGARQPRLES